MQELKPCPFCGKEPEYDNCDLGSGQWIGCDCGAMVKSSYRSDEYLTRWNTRPIEDAKDSRIKELEAALKPFAQFECGCGECNNCVADNLLNKEK